MATLLDAGIANFLSPVIVLVLLVTLIYAMLVKSKLFGDNKMFAAVIAFAVAFLFLFTPGMTGIIQVFTPWFALLFMSVLFVIMFFIFLGVKEETVVKEVISTPTFVTFAVIAFLIVILVAIGKVYGPVFAVNQQPGFWNAFRRVVFSPRALGMFFLLVVAAYTIRFLSDTTKK